MHKFVHGKYGNTLAKLSLLSLSAVSVLGYTPSIAKAASLVDAKDTLTTINTSATADHTIVFKLGAGKTFSANEKISVDFPSEFTVAGTWVAGDFSFSDGASKTIAADCESPNTAGVAFFVDSVNSRFDFSACGSYVESATNATITITIDGTTTDGTLTNPSAAAVYKVGITNNNGLSEDDTTQIAIPIISDDSVNITATVDPTLSFTISDTTIGFGTLATGAARYARGDLAGSSDNSSSAHSLEVSTNATSGYVISYKGATLTSQSDSGDTITSATIAGSSSGTAGSEQFAVSFTGTSGATVVSDYDQGSSNWKFVPNTTTTVVSNDAPTGTANIKVRYIANISSITEAGVYTTDIYYIATGTF